MTDQRACPHRHALQGVRCERQTGHPGEHRARIVVHASTALLSWGTSLSSAPDLLDGHYEPVGS